MDRPRRARHRAPGGLVRKATAFAFITALDVILQDPAERPQ